MIINVDKDSLLKSINIAESVISTKTVNAVLANCLFQVYKEKIIIISTDNDIAVRTTINAISNEQGSFTVHGKKFSSILKELPNDELEITIDDSLLIDIKTKSKNIKGHYTLIGSNSEDYPEVPVFDDGNAIEIDQFTFKEMIKKVFYAASNDSIKPVFNSVFLLSEKKSTLIAVATDSRRLSVISRNIDSEIDFEDGIIIPLKTINELLRILDGNGNCKFAYKNNQCFFQAGNTEIISRVVEGQYPNFKQVIPKENSKKSTIETKKFLDSVKRAMVFSREPANKIILTFSGDKLHIEANTPELGKAEEEILIESNNDDTVTLGVNAQFLIDSLREIDSTSVVCGITSHMSPMTFKPEDDNNYTSVIMPIQIKSNED